MGGLEGVGYGGSGVWGWLDGYGGSLMGLCGVVLLALFVKERLGGE